MGAWLSLVAMLAFWLILSLTTGVSLPEMVILGVLLTLLVKRLDRGLLEPDAFSQPSRWLEFSSVLLRTLLVLLRDVVRANLQIAAVILNPRLPINPRMVEYRTRLSTLGGRVALSNAITLTPGTLTVRLDEDTLLVHALTPAAEEGLQDWQVERLLQRLEEC